MSHQSKCRLSELSQKLKNDPGLPKLNPTESYWQSPEADHIGTIQSSELPTSTDVVIIGSGITGCSVARHLLQVDSSIKVTILEARTICSGATGRNGGHIKAVPEHSYAELVPFLGREKATEVVNFTLANMEALLHLSETSMSTELRGHSEVRRVRSLNIFTDSKRYEEFTEMVEKFRQDHPNLAGRGRLVSKDQLEKTYNVPNAVGGYEAPAGAGWPYRLITGLFAEMLEQYGERLKIESRTPVQSVAFEKDETLPYVIDTSRGKIRAKHVVHATNGHTGYLLPRLRGQLFPVRGQMSTQTPSSSFGVQGGGQSWSIHYGSGFDYMTQSGKTGEIFLGGGLAQADQRGVSELGNSDDNVNSVLATAHLGGIVNAVFGPNAQTKMKAAWTGVMGFTADGLPLVGKVPEQASGRPGSSEWIAAGFNGYGMANAWLCGKYVSTGILQRQDQGAVKLPSTYLISPERLSAMHAEDAAKYWLETLGLD